MNSKGHLYISLIKSGIRIVGCIDLFMTGSLGFFAGAFCAAELLGIVEELVDER